MMGKQLVHVVGAVVVVAVVILGMVVIALPMLSQSFNTVAQTANVESTNQILAGQVTRLEQEKSDTAGLEADVSALQKQIPETPQQDQVFELVANAAAATGVVVTAATADVPVPWALRAPPVVGPDGVPSTDQAPGSVSSAPSPSPSASPSPAPSATPGPEAATSGSTTVAPTSPQMQIPFKIVVTSTDPAAPAAFIDALGAGPRLLSIVHSVLTNEETGKYTLTIDAFAFERTQD